MAATTADPFAATASGESHYEPRGNAATVAIGPAVVTRHRLNGSPQQEAFWAELLDGDTHILLEARAGTGKSTSAREGMHRMLERDRQLQIRYCCFNKKIADEFGEKCPPGVEVGTMHRFGLMALKDSFGCQLDQHKSYTLMDAMAGGTNLKRYVRKAISTVVSLTKNSGYFPGEEDLKAKLDALIWQYDVETWGQQATVIRWAAEVLERAGEMTIVVDFDDMLWMAVLHGVRFPQVDTLFIDECQDCNVLQHAMAEQMCSSGRIVVIGDPYQSIYAFRGADSESIARLKARLDAKVMPLTVTFRCPRRHVELARQLVPDFEAAPSAPEGEVVMGNGTELDNAVPGDLVLCRANAPIVQACLRQVARRKPSIVRGRSIGDSLMAVVRKIDAATIAEFGRQVDIWRAGEIDRLSARDGTEGQIEAVVDKADSLIAIASSCQSPSEVPTAIGQLFADDDSSTRVTFSSVHRAKGSEARNVTYLQIPYGDRRDKLRPPQAWELQQRRNLRYVALTRSQHRLNLVTL